MISTERIATDPRAGALPATVVQRAICRVLDGVPLGDLASRPEVQRLLGGDVTGYVTAPPAPPRCVVLLAGVRAGKSYLAACAAVRAALTCDLSDVRPSEVVRSAVVSIDTDRARAVVEHVHGLARSPLLRPLIVPHASGATVRRGDGRTVDVRVEAASRDGGTLVARWLAGVVYDEAPRMRGRSDGGVIALEDLRRAVMGRLRPGAQELVVGAPAGPRGAVYDLVRAWESAGARQTPSLVVMRASAVDMHPSWWTPERVAALRAADPDAYATEVAGEWGTADEALLSAAAVDACVRDAPIPADATVIAAMDPATRGDAWGLVVVAEHDGLLVVAETASWRGSRSAPLDPVSVMGEIAEVVGRHGAAEVMTDQASADALTAIGARLGVGVRPVATTAPRTRARALRLRAAVDAGRLVLRRDQEPLLRDLRALRRRVGVGGEWTVALPRTGDGHCDLGSALLLAMEALRPAAATGAAAPVTPEAAMRRAVVAAMRDAERAPMPWDF